LADIITAFTKNSQSEFIINRGKEDGLVKGQFVLGEHSIVGTVSDLDSRTARICLVTDLDSKTAVRIGESNLHGIMQGNGDGSARIELLPTKYKVKIGDIVYVQKKPGFLDSPMIVGIVVQCKTDDKNPLFWDIKIDPACNLQKLNCVSVIVMDSQEQYQNCNAEQPADSQVMKQEKNVFLAIDKENSR
jgi:rod shape-determining protein MreC